MKKKTIIIFISVLIFAALILAAGYFLYKNKNKNILTLYGNIEIRQSDLSFRVPGRLSALYVEEGDFVKEGALLAELDSDIYITALNKAKADLKRQRAEKLKQTAIFNYNNPLCADFTVSKEECSNIKETMNASIASYEYALAALEKSIIDLDDTKLYAPYDGTILSRVREKGTILNTSDIVYSISMIKPVWIRAYIDEKNLGNIKLGQKAFVYTDARPKTPYIAHIGFVSPVAEFTPKTVETTNLRTDLVYRLRIIVDNIDPYLRQGMPVTVKVHL